MCRPDRTTIVPGQRTTGFHRLAHFLALMAMLLNQPLTAIHAATDEKHFLHAMAQAAHLGGTTHHHGHQHEGQPHPDYLHEQTCQVCPLVGSTLAPPGAAIMANTLGWHHAAGPAAVRAARVERRLRAGDRVRAPPRLHPI
jgi:hypothetical protein